MKKIVYYGSTKNSSIAVRKTEELWVLLWMSKKARKAGNNHSDNDFRNVKYFNN